MKVRGHVLSVPEVNSGLTLHSTFSGFTSQEHADDDGLERNLGRKGQFEKQKHRRRTRLLKAPRHTWHAWLNT
jgi:hypothetical protein